MGIRNWRGEAVGAAAGAGVGGGVVHSRHALRADTALPSQAGQRSSTQIRLTPSHAAACGTRNHLELAGYRAWDEVWAQGTPPLRSPISSAGVIRHFRLCPRRRNHLSSPGPSVTLAPHPQLVCRFKTPCTACWTACYRVTQAGSRLLFEKARPLVTGGAAQPRRPIPPPSSHQCAS